MEQDVDNGQERVAETKPLPINAMCSVSSRATVVLKSTQQQPQPLYIGIKVGAGWRRALCVLPV